MLSATLTRTPAYPGLEDPCRAAVESTSASSGGLGIEAWQRRWLHLRWSRRSTTPLRPRYIQPGDLIV